MYVLDHNVNIYSMALTLFLLSLGFAIFYSNDSNCISSMNWCAIFVIWRNNEIYLDSGWYYLVVPCTHCLFLLAAIKTCATVSF